MISETKMFSDRTKALQEALDSNTITIDVRYHLKTSVEVYLRHKVTSMGVNFDIEGFKTKMEQDWNMISGSNQTRYFFKILKSQGFQELKTYVEYILKHIYRDYELPEDFTCQWYNTNPIKDLNK